MSDDDEPRELTTLGEKPITELLSYKVRRLANALSSSAAARYRREFDVSLPEWRTLALLGRIAPMSSNSLARLAALDKAQMSRVITGLVARGLVRKELGPRRSSQLTLTPHGKTVFAGLITAANDRERELLRGFTSEEQKELERALAMLTERALAMREAEELHQDPIQGT